MPSDINRLVLEGFCGPAIVRSDASGTLIARTYLTVGVGSRRFSVLLRGVGETAAAIADIDAADIVRVLGKLAWDATARRLVIDVLKIRFTGRAGARKRRSVATILASTLDPSAHGHA